MMIATDILVREVHDDDADEIMSIVREHGLPDKWQWPSKAYAGTVAVCDDAVVAFCALSQTIYGLVIDEFWCKKSREGVLGLGALSRWIEMIAQREADERGEPIDLGGVCRLDNEHHLAALKKRGYETVAEVLSKTFTPQEVG